MITKEELQELKDIHLENTGEEMSDQEALEMGTRLLNLFRVIGKDLTGNKYSVKT